MSGAKITIDSIVRSFLIEKDEDFDLNYMRYLHLAIQGMEDLDFDVSGMPIYIEAATEDNSTIIIPDDAVKIIGVHFNKGGRWVSFAEDWNLNMSVGDSCGTEDYPDVHNNNTNSTNFHYGNATTETSTNHFRNGQSTGGYYNAREANQYLYRINDSNGTVELSSNAPSIVILEYLPTSKQVNGQFMVTSFLREPVIAWLNWVSVRSKPATSVNVANQLQRVYVKAKEHLDNRLQTLTEANFKQAVNFGRTASPRF